MADSLGEAFITFTSKGFTGLQGQLKSMAGSVSAFTSNAAKQFQNLSNAAKPAFATLTGTILGSVAAANSDVFGVLTGGLKLLGATVGTIVVPVLRDLTVWVVQVAKWVSNLSPETKAMIATFVEWGIVITGVAVAVNTLGSVFGGLIGAVAKFVIGNPILGLLAGAAYLVYELIGGFDGLKRIVSSLTEIFAPVFDGVSQMLSDMAADFKGFIDTLTELFPGLGDVAKSVFEGIGKVIGWVVDGISTLVRWIEKALIAIGIAVKKVSNWEFSGIGDEIGEAWDKMDEKAAKHREDKAKGLGIAPDKGVEKSVDRQLALAAQSGFMGSNKGVSVSGIAGAWQAVQSAMKSDPALNLARENIDIQKEQREIMRGIRGGVEKLGRNDRELAFGG